MDDQDRTQTDVILKNEFEVSVVARVENITFN